MNPGTRKRLRRGWLNFAGIVLLIFAIFPVFWMVSTAFKPSTEIYSTTPHPLPLHPTLHQFSQVLGSNAGGQSYWVWFRNSVIIALGTVVLSSLVAMLAATAVARYGFRFRATFLVLMIIVQVAPAEAIIVPLFLDMKSYGLLDSQLGIVLVYSAFAVAFAVLMLRGFVEKVPRELEESARVDGAGPVRVFWRILFPLVAPGLVATSIFSFIASWNELIYAYTFLSSQSKQTLPIELQFLQTRGGTDFGPTMAATTLLTIPVLIFFLAVQRRMVSGLTAGAVKG